MRQLIIFVLGLFFSCFVYGQYKTYTIEKGDTLSGISKKHYGSADRWKKLHSHNPQIKNPHLIYPGHALSLYKNGFYLSGGLGYYRNMASGDKSELMIQPAPSTPYYPVFVATVHAAARHDVVKNDTLSHIAQHHLGDAQHWPLLHQRNARHVKNPHLIYPGQQLRIRNAWYGDVAVGAGLGFTGKSQTLVMQPGIDFGYDAHRGQTAYLIGIGGGHSFVLTPA